MSDEDVSDDACRLGDRAMEDSWVILADSVSNLIEEWKMKTSQTFLAYWIMSGSRVGSEKKRQTRVMVG
jgi:hypothetical protein